MASDAFLENLHIIAVSAYRSYSYQENLYNNYVKEKGFYYADLCSARAGHSEHQTGLAIDIADKSYDYDNFYDTKEYLWVRDNAHKYGFILRYPISSYHITGFKFEPWHIRYVGDIAYIIYENNLKTFDIEEILLNKYLMSLRIVSSSLKLIVSSSENISGKLPKYVVVGFLFNSVT